MATTILTPSRALRRPRHLDGRAILALLILVVGVLGSLAHWSSLSDSRGLLVLTHDLPAGAILQPSDLRVAQIRLDNGLYTTALPASDQDAVVGKPLTEAVHGGSLLLRPQLSARPSIAAGHLALTVPATADNAAGGRIHPGDTVQLLVTLDKGKPDAHTDVVLDQVQVWDVADDARANVVNPAGATAAGTTPPLRSVTLIVTPAEARQVTLAYRTGDVDLALRAVEP